MTLGIFGKEVNINDLINLQYLIQKLEEAGIELCCYAPFFDFLADRITFKPKYLFKNHVDIENKIDLLLSIGGDGTLLDTVHLVRKNNIPVLGINMGRLGFLASIAKNDIDYCIECLLKKDFIIEKRTLLSIESPKNLFGDFNYALNDISIYRKNMSSMIAVSAYVNENFLNTYYGDGIIIATPTGSTAYSMSCNGPILTPNSETLVITPIANHMLTVRPIIIANDSIIRLQADGSRGDFLVTLDSKNIEIESGTEIIIKKADFKFNLVTLPNRDFFTTIREKLMWGIDKRGSIQN